MPRRFKCTASKPSREWELPENLVRGVDGVIRVNPNITERQIEQIPAMVLEAEVEIFDVRIGSLGAEAFELTVPIPNGTRVSAQDSPHLDFAWQDGRVVPASEIFAGLGNADPEFSGGTRGKWLIGANALFIAVGGAYYLWRKKCAQNE